MKNKKIIVNLFVQKIKNNNLILISFFFLDRFNNTMNK